MQSKKEGNLIFIRLFTDEDLCDELKQVCQQYKVKSVVVLSGIGQMKNFELGYFKEKGDYTPQMFRSVYELLSLSGNISNQEGEYYFHIHAILGDEKKKVVGGHLLRGKVESTSEIVLLMTDLRMSRRIDEITGLNAMFLD